MKEPERFPADDPREWMNRARRSLVDSEKPRTTSLSGRPVL